MWSRFRPGLSFHIFVNEVKRQCHSGIMTHYSMCERKHAKKTKTGCLRSKASGAWHKELDNVVVSPPARSSSIDSLRRLHLENWQ